MRKKRYVFWLILFLILTGFGVLIKKYIQNNGTKSEIKNPKINHDSIQVIFHSGIDTTFSINGETFHLKDFSKKFDFMVSKTDSNVHINEYGNNYDYWRHFLTKPHPTVETMRKYFIEASNEFGVPSTILEAIGKVENNWTQIGPTIDQGWGVMHLVHNNYCKTLDEAAELLNLSVEDLKENARENIRGAAALLAKYAGPERINFKTFNEWLPALEEFSGLINEQLRKMQAAEYLKIINNGSESITLWGDTIKLKPHTKNY